ncbi:MAG: TatD family hydrolase [Pseudomonadota bacterium]
MLVDSHCHLDRCDLSRYDGDFSRLMAETRAQGVEHLLCVNIDLANFEPMRRLVEPYPEVSISVGVHPHEQDQQETDVDTLVALARDPRVVAIGETGLDYYREEGDLEWQRARFRTHIRAARQCGKPLIVHTRDAREDTIEILREEGAEVPGGVLHCFTETWEMARSALELGFYISFSGILTFKNAQDLREVAAKVPLDRLLIETDSPYLAPVPYRGKPNEPRYLLEVAKQLAEVRGLPLQRVAEITRENFFRLFSHALPAPSRLQ